jgi:rubrerythrin
MGRATVTVRIDDRAGLSRGQVLRRGSVALGVLCTGGVLITGLPGRADSAGLRPSDERILNFALVLEHLQAAFYAEAATATALDGDVLAFARTAAAHEREHINLLARLLGPDAKRPPSFDFGDTTSDQARFLRVATALEDLGVAAYNGQAANLGRRALAQTSRIASVDARHAAWIRSLAGKVPAPEAVDAGRTAKAVMADVAHTGFVTEGG